MIFLSSFQSARLMIVIASLSASVPAIAAEPEPTTETVLPKTGLDQLVARPGEVVGSGTASWYGNGRRGRRTASGRRFNPEEMTAASATLPLGMKVLVTLEGTARSVLVIITDRQAAAHRVIDLSLAAARKIGIVSRGTARVTLRRA